MTDEKALIEYCLTKKGAYKDFPFGDDVTVIKAEKRIFAQFFTLRACPHSPKRADFEANFFADEAEIRRCTSRNSNAVSGKICLNTPLSGYVDRLLGVPSATLNCDAVTGDFYRRLYPGVIVRGYHCPLVRQPYFNTFPLDGRVPDELIIEMIDHSYTTVVGKLPKYKQKQLSEQDQLTQLYNVHKYLAKFMRRFVYLVPCKTKYFVVE